MRLVDEKRVDASSAALIIASDDRNGVCRRGELLRKRSDRRGPKREQREVVSVVVPTELIVEPSAHVGFRGRDEGRIGA